MVLLLLLVLLLRCCCAIVVGSGYCCCLLFTVVFVVVYCLLGEISYKSKSFDVGEHLRTGYEGVIFVDSQRAVGLWGRGILHHNNCQKKT